MDESRPTNQKPWQDEIPPPISANDLQGTWIGLGAAVEWIAFRGETLSTAEFEERFVGACEAIVGFFADLPPEIAEANAQGIFEGDNHPELKPITNGVWAQTAASDESDADKPFRMLTVDDTTDGEGAILATHYPGYRRVRIRSWIILANWPEHESNVEPTPARTVEAQARVVRLFEKLVADAPKELTRLTQGEMEDTIRHVYPGARRDFIRGLYRAQYRDGKPGPKGKRIPHRKELLAKFREEMKSAELRN